LKVPTQTNRVLLFCGSPCKLVLYHYIIFLWNRNIAVIQIELLKLKNFGKWLCLVFWINMSVNREGDRAGKDQGFLVKVICSSLFLRYDPLCNFLSFMGCLYLFLFSFSMKKPDWLVCLGCFMGWKHLRLRNSFCGTQHVVSCSLWSLDLWGFKGGSTRKTWIKPKKSNKLEQVGSAAGTH